jgi:hypothetical protein
MNQTTSSLDHSGLNTVLICVGPRLLTLVASDIRTSGASRLNAGKRTAFLGCGVAILHTIYVRARNNERKVNSKNGRGNHGSPYWQAFSCRFLVQRMVPDRVLRRWTCLPSIIAAPISRNWDWMSSRVARPSSVPHRAGGVLAAMEVLKGKDAIPLSTRQSVVA